MSDSRGSPFKIYPFSVYTILFAMNSVIEYLGHGIVPRGLYFPFFFLSKVYFCVGCRAPQARHLKTTNNRYDTIHPLSYRAFRVFTASLALALGLALTPSSTMASTSILAYVILVFAVSLLIALTYSSLALDSA